MERSPTLPTVETLITNRVYKIESRNLSFGVWNWAGYEPNSFTGIRTKFGSSFLDCEIHYDADEKYGTVSDAVDTGIDIPVYIKIQNGKLRDRFLKKFLEEIEENDKRKTKTMET